MESGFPRVLVVDDTESIRALIRINLELDGCVVEEASDGQAALRRLIDPEADLPDVVLVDSQMHPRDGWWTIAAIREHPRLAGIPVALVTASVQVHDRIQAQEAGFDAFIAKPFDPEQIMEVVSWLAEEGRPPAGAS